MVGTHFRPPAWLVVTLALALALQVTLVNYWPAFASPNERARAYQALALAMHGRLSIDDELMRFGAMEDVARTRGRSFPNKAPGLLPLVVPAACLARLVTAGETAAALRFTLFAGRLLAATLPFLGTVLLLAYLLVPRLPRGGPLAVAAYALATPALAASVLLFSHAFAAFCLVAAFALWYRSSPPTPLGAALGGLLLGWAAAAEYTVAVPAAVLGLAALPRLRGRGVASAIAGGIVPLSLLGLYNLECFGSPTALSTTFEAHPAFATLVAHGIFGISWPAPAGLVGLLFSPSRGLVVWAPIVVIAVAGFSASSRRVAPPAVVPAALAALSLIVLFSGYPNWHGGWFPGPRYLLPALPLLFLAVGAGAETLLARRWGRTLAAATVIWGGVAVILPLATFPFPPEDFHFPWLSLALPLAAEGIHTPSWLPSGAALPLIATAGVALLALLVRLAAGADRLAALTAVLLVAVALPLAARSWRPTLWQPRLERAVVHDVYVRGRAGSLERLLAQSVTPAQRAEVERWIAVREHRAGSSHEGRVLHSEPWASFSVASRHSWRCGWSPPAGALLQGWRSSAAEP